MSRKEINFPWDGAISPFKIAGNVYFVGTFQASSHLIDTGDGLILIDTGYENTLYLLIDSIYALGFNPRDVKYIINTHWHWDHTEGTRALAALSGAKTLIGAPDFENAKKYFDADILINDGDTLTLGNTTIEFLSTPGHTKGTVSLFFTTEEAGKTYRVGMFGGAGLNTLAEGEFDYDNCREDYPASLHRLQKEKVDIFIGNHVWNNNTEKKGEILKNGGENQFIDDTAWNTFLTSCEENFNKLVSASAE